MGNRNSGSNPDRSLLLRWCAMLFKMVVPNGCVSVTYVLVCVQLHHVALSALLINRWRCRFCVDHCYQHLRHRRWLVWLSMIVVLARMIPSVRYLQVSDSCCGAGSTASAHVSGGGPSARNRRCTRPNSEEATRKRGQKSFCTRRHRQGTSVTDQHRQRYAASVLCPFSRISPLAQPHRQ